MHKFQQVSVQGVPLKMLTLLTSEQQEGRICLWSEKLPVWTQIHTGQITAREVTADGNS